MSKKENKKPKTQEKPDDERNKELGDAELKKVSGGFGRRGNPRKYCPPKSD